jgi:cytochrome c-type biogenesis protein CcmH/NrfG
VQDLASDVARAIIRNVEGAGMRLSTVLQRRSLIIRPILLQGVVFLSLSISPVRAQQQPLAGAPASDVSNIPKPAVDMLDQVTLRNRSSDVQPKEKGIARDESCLLPPLIRMASPTVAVEQLQKTAKARNEYHQGCTALEKKSMADAEKHFRKALHEYPQYAMAWVTLGQVFATQQRTDEARNACFQGLRTDPTYVPAYLCLADIAAHANAWDEVLRLSGRALELNPSSNAVAYEYHAAANLNLRNLAAAEKSGLRAAEIDREHREPRVHFVLAQIYEAKGDFANEAMQLREYLKYADNAPDAAMVQQYLSNLKRRTNTKGIGESGVVDSLRSARQDWAPPDIDASVPPVLREGACPMPQILRETSNHALELIESMRRFSASERIEHIDIDKNGKRRNSSTQMVNYVAEIEQNSSGYPSIHEYRSGSTGIRQPSMMDSGSAVFALIFHPSHVANFEFQCEGLTELQGSPAWQVHFVERPDPNKSFTAIRSGSSVNLTTFKGRAWITTDGYNVLRIETDLIAPIAQINLQREHRVIVYAPVEFPSHHVRLWLPESSSLYIAYRGHRYERVHNLSEFQLFSVESTEAVKQPNANKTSEFLSETLDPPSFR